jgi:asparagine synthase (glutamine-hydrolysing)
MHYARIAARHFGTDHHEHYLTPDELLEGIPKVAAHYDQPFGNSSVVPAYYCAKLAQEDGVEKLLAGDGGDELFGGNTRYAKQRVFEAYWHVPQILRTRAIEKLIDRAPVFDRAAWLRKGVSYVRQARVPMPDRMNTYNLLVRLGPENVFTPDFLAQVRPDAPQEFEREVYARSDATVLVNRMLQYDWKFTLADNDLPKVRGAAEVAGVRVGFPLLSDDLVDFSLRLPPSMKLKGLKLRYFFKEALRDFLPDDILRKRKHGFGLPFGVWLNRHGPLQDFAFGSLSALAQRGFVKRQFIEELISHRVSEHPGFYGELVWILMMLEQWLQRNKAANLASAGNLVHPQKQDAAAVQ